MSASNSVHDVCVLYIVSYIARRVKKQLLIAVCCLLVQARLHIGSAGTVNQASVLHKQDSLYTCLISYASCNIPRIAS